MLLDGLDISGLVWADELDYTGIASESAAGINSAIIVQEVALAGDRPVTLSGDANTGWLSRAALKALQTKAQAAGASYVLNYNGTNYTVRFRHEEAPVIAATPIVGRENAADGDWYNNVTLKLAVV